MATHHGSRTEGLATRNDVRPTKAPDDTSARTMRKVLEGMVASIQSLAADPSFKSLYERIDRIHELDEKIKQKDELIANLQLELQKSEASHKAMQQESLQVYNLKYEELKAAREEVQRKVEGLQGRLSGNETTIEILKKEKSGMTDKITQLEQSIQVKTNESENARNTIRELRGDVKTNQDAKEKAERDIQHYQAQVKQTQAEMKTLQKASHTWENRAKAAEQRLKDVDSLTVKLDEGIPTPA